MLETRSQQIPGSVRGVRAQMLLTPDTCVCADCLRELLDPADRRYRYPFVNCANCGPRYSIVQGAPYERELTTMAAFPMCERCEREYHDGGDRRFHAQPIACWECGPRVALVGPGERPPETYYRPERGPAGCGGLPAGLPDPIAMTVELLREGAIVAVKGIGGYHLFVDARNEHAVAELRRRKQREERPFAVMSPTLEAVRGYAQVEEHEAELLEGVERPIVPVRKRAGDCGLAAGIAPGNRRYGAVLAYTPLHHLLFQGGFDGLVATSGNVSDEPIAFRDEEALERLRSIADAFLIGQREIFTRVEDSIVGSVRLGGRPARSERTPIRRARGQAPKPVRAPFELPALLAVGGESKSAICLSRGAELFLSHHIGDVKDEATLRSFEHAIEHLSRLLEVTPAVIAHDMHPDYLSTRFALAQRALPTVAVQHHHAHMAACMCEHGLTEPAIGVIFDGAGYGTDGNIWGGEFLVGDYVGFERAAHLRYFRLPGGDRALEEPYRVALSLLHDAHGGSLAGVDLPVVVDRAPAELQVLERMLERGVGSPLTSSMGRLFDGVAALIGVRERCRYEAQGAIELEQLIEPGASARPFQWELCGTEEWPWRIDPTPMVRELAREASRRHVTAAELSLRFHRTVIDMARGTCAAIRERTGLSQAVLSGAVFQSEYLLRGCHEALCEEGFDVYIHRQVPANDGGLALGQAAVAGWGSW